MFLALAVPFPLFASGETPQIQLSVSQASPGALIEVIGGRFEPDAVITFVLYRPENQVQLGTVMADDHGEFTSAILLPIDLPYGQYEFKAADEHSRVATAALTISRDTSEQEENDQRGEEEPLLVPMPQNKAVAPAPQTAMGTAVSAPMSAGDSSAWWLFPLVAVIGAGVGAALVLRRRTPRS